VVVRPEDPREGQAIALVSLVSDDPEVLGSCLLWGDVQGFEDAIRTLWSETVRLGGGHALSTQGRRSGEPQVLRLIT
jgi:hypothetical protein